MDEPRKPSPRVNVGQRRTVLERPRTIAKGLDWGGHDGESTTARDDEHRNASVGAGDGGGATYLDDCAPRRTRRGRERQREGDGEDRLRVEHRQTMAEHAKCGHRIYMVIRDSSSAFTCIS